MVKQTNVIHKADYGNRVKEEVVFFPVVPLSAGRQGTTCDSTESKRRLC